MSKIWTEKGGSWEEVDKDSFSPQFEGEADEPIGLIRLTRRELRLICNTIIWIVLPITALFTVLLWRVTVATDCMNATNSAAIIGLVIALASVVVIIKEIS